MKQILAQSPLRACTSCVCHAKLHITAEEQGLTQLFPLYCNQLIDVTMRETSWREGIVLLAHIAVSLVIF